MLYIDENLLANLFFMMFNSNMDNKITFTGITNLSVARRLSNKFGTYITSAGDVKQGDKAYAEFRIKFKLTDDESGQDLTDYKNALSKCNKSFQAKCLGQNLTDEFVFSVKRCSVMDDAEKISNSNFMFNNIGLLPNERSILPLFSYLAKLTRKMASLPDISEAKKDIFKQTNQSIQEEAVKYIENMPPLSK